MRGNTNTQGGGGHIQAHKMGIHHHTDIQADRVGNTLIHRVGNVLTHTHGVG